MVNVQKYITDNNLLFGSFYIEWLESGVQAFINVMETYQTCSDVVQSEFLKTLYGRLSSIAMRTLIEEMHVCKDQGRLSGSDSREEYRYFHEGILKDKNYRKYLLEKYPVLQFGMDCICKEVTFHLCEVIHRFYQDKIGIEKTILHNRINQITGLQANLSDSHNQGKSVVRLEVDSSYYVIYKPHAIENDQIFHEIISELGRKMSLESREWPILCCDGYGWEAYVPQVECRDQEEVQRFYKRMGVGLLVSYLLKTTDLHQENLIACGEYPVFVDMEALFTVPQNRLITGIQEEIQQFIRTSVMSTGILPFYHWNGQNQGISVSALSESKEQVSPVRIPVPVDLYTSDMRIDYVYGKITPAKNAVYVNGEKIIPETYRSAVVDGFIKAYELVMKEKILITKWIPQLRNLYSRYLMADTQKYSMILSTSCHPKLLTNESGREELYEKVWPSQNTESETMHIIHQHEKMDLRQGDIPIFYIKFDSLGLYHAGKEIVRNYLQSSPQDYLQRMLSSMNSVDLQKQVMLIETALNIPSTQINKPLGEVSEFKELENIEKTKIFKSAVQKLLDFAIYTVDGREISWLNPQITGNEMMRFQMKGMGMYLYDGLAGMSLLFSVLVYQMHFEEYRNICEKLKNQLFSYTEKVNSDIRFAESARTGIFNGESAIAAVYLLNYKLSGDAAYLDKAAEHAEIVKTLLQSDKNDDLLDGKAGAVLIFSELYALLQDKKYLTWAMEAAHYLTESAIAAEDEMTWAYPGLPQPLLGMAHGNAGISLAYGKLYELTGKQEYLVCLEKVIRYEHRRYSKNLQDWYDYRNVDYENASKKEPVAWCHGAGGILSARLELLHLNLPDSLREMVDIDIQRAVPKLKSGFGRENLCICHGISGNLLIMKKYLKEFTDSEMEHLCKRVENHLWQCLKNDQIDLMRERYGMGLMIGYAGSLFGLTA